MRALVTGAGGQLGTEVVRRFRAAGADVVGVDRAQLDVADPGAASLWIEGHGGFDVVVNAAAWTAVDDCESDPDRAYAVNALGCRWLAQACRQTGTHLVHVSTDYVFDGTKDGAYHEWDPPDPRSVYGASKLAGEHEIAAHAPGATVVRTSWVFGAHGRNVVKTVLALRDRPELAFVDDQRGCPTAAADLAGALWTLADQRVPGLFHVTNGGPTTWYGFARDVLEAAGEDPGKVRPITTAELDPPRAAPRPANSELDGMALRLAGIPPLRHYREALDEVVRTLLA